MAPVIHCVRHAEGYHNLSVLNHTLHDPSLTQPGCRQCHKLAHDFPFAASIELVVASPLRRTISTALLAFPGYLRRGSKILCHPDAQETGSVPCDRGSDPGALKNEFGERDIDFGLLHDGWNGKTGRYAPDRESIAARAKELRKWLRDRSEKEIVVVSHGGFLQFMTEGETDRGWFAGAGWDNCEFRTYLFDSNGGESAPLVETTESHWRRQGRLGGL